MCWPTFVFRGTDFDDFRGLGLITKFNCTGLGEALEKGSQNLKKHIKATKPAADYRVKRSQAFNTYTSQTDVLISLRSDEILNFLDANKIEEILSTYLNNTFIFEDDLKILGKKQNINPMSGKKQLLSS